MSTKKTTSAAKKTTKAGVRADYANGARVKVLRQDGKWYKGFVKGNVKQTQTGAFIPVNVGTKDVVIMVNARPATVKSY
jgi:hypothetical protein